MMTQDELRDYLDDSIRAWREQRDSNIGRAEEHTATCYIDAFQSVRVSVFGELLPGDSPLTWAK